MNESVEVGVTAEWRATEPLGISLTRELTIEALEPESRSKGLSEGLALQAVGDKSVVGFALDGVMAIIEKAKKPGSTLVLSFAAVGVKGAADLRDLSPMVRTGASLPPGVDKSKVDFAALIKTGSTPSTDGSTPVVTAAAGSQGTTMRDTFARLADSGGPVSVDFTQAGPLGIHFSDTLPLRAVKIGERSAASATALSVGMALTAVSSSSIIGLSHEMVIEAIRGAARPLTLTFDAVIKVMPETAGMVSSCAVVGSKMVEAAGYFSRPYTTYTIACLVEGGVYEVDMRYSDVFDFHEQWTMKLMAAALPVYLPEKNLSYAMKNTPETVAERRAGIQHYFDSCFKLGARLESSIFDGVLQEFLHGRPVTAATEAVCRNSWDVVGKWDYSLPVEFFESTYQVPHTLLLRGAGEERSATFTAQVSKQ